MCLVYRHFESGKRTPPYPVFGNALIQNLFDLFQVIHRRIVTAFLYGLEIDLEVFDGLIIDLIKFDVL